MMRIALVPLAMIGSAAAAQTIAQTATPTGTVAAADKPVCRYLTPTGSLMGTRVCKTRAQWAVADGGFLDAVSKGRTSNTMERSQGEGNLIR